MTPSERPMVTKLKPVAPAKLVKPAKLVSCNPPEMLEPVSEILREIEKARGRKLFALICSHIDEDTFEEAYRWRAELKSAEEDGLDVLIHSPGGALGSCYQVARLLARRANGWEALVPSLAASGASLICLGSANLVMSELAQLGPIDPQVISKRHEKFFQNERQSPLEAFQAVKYLREQALTTLDASMRLLMQRQIAPKPALEAASGIAFHIVQPILSKIEAYDLGALALDMNLASNYCERIANPSDKSRKTQREASFKAIVEQYPAHEFVIDIEEARALGFSVCDPTPEVDELFDRIRPLLDDVAEFIGFAPTGGSKTNEVREADAS